MSTSLPDSLNVKLVEVWMMFCLILPLVEVTLQTYLQVGENLAIYNTVGEKYFMCHAGKLTPSLKEMYSTFQVEWWMMLPLLQWSHSRLTYS